MSEVDSIKQTLKTRKPKMEEVLGADNFLSTGSTLLNMALSGDPKGGFCKGKYFFLVGDSSSGKTFLSLTCLMEASLNPAFDNYRFIFDDVEGGALMDIAKFFGPQVVERMEPPARDKQGPIYSATIEEFYFHLDDALQHKKPCIYILDSMDSLSSDYEEKKFLEKKKAHRKGTQAKGDYGDGKAKMNSSMLRPRIADIKDTGSILIIINQTRDNINAGMFEAKKTRSGGHALTFYATAEIWSSMGAKIVKNVLGKKRQVGVISNIRVQKNRISGRNRRVEVPIYYSIGIDDIGGCINYLLEEGCWKRKGSKIQMTGLGPELVATETKLIQHIEEHGLEEDLQQLVAMTWNDIEKRCAVKRKMRYER